MKKIISIVTVLVLLVACMAVSAFAAENATVTVENATAKIGDSVTVKVSISEATFNAYGMKLVYNTEALELTKIEVGAASEKGFFDGNHATGVVAYANSVNVTTSGVLFTATFTVKAAGKHDVKVEVDSIVKEDGSKLNVAVENGLISVECAHKWEVTKRPASEEEGCFLEYKCSICGETKRTDKEAHTWELVELTEEGERQKCSFCGVERIYNPESGDMIGVVIALLAVSGLGITVLRKREN